MVVHTPLNHSIQLERTSAGSKTTGFRRFNARQHLLNVPIARHRTSLEASHLGRHSTLNSIEADRDPIQTSCLELTAHLLRQQDTVRREGHLTQTLHGVTLQTTSLKDVLKQRQQLRAKQWLTPGQSQSVRSKATRDTN